MTSETPQSEDAYSRLEYRRLIAWGPRIEREAPFLQQLLDRAPDRSVLDVGCGTGEHTAFLARHGARAVGIDRSEEMIEKARDHESRGHGRFLLGDAGEAREILRDDAPFGLAICLGNMLPHILESAEMDRFLEEIRGVLLPGGLLLFQLLNYRRILDQGIRHLPLNFREGDQGEEIVFLRLMAPVSRERILFFPTTLSIDPEAEQPLAVRGTRRVELRPWTLDDLEPRLVSRGFQWTLHGDMQGGEFREQESADLVVVATTIDG